jgi:putative ABC transport system permease protein
MAYGTFFNSAGQMQYGAVIGQQVATQLFGEAAPLGHSFVFRGQQFIVDGVFNSFDTVPFTLSADFNDAIFVSESVVQSLTNNTAPIYEILVKPQNPNLTNQVSAAIKSGLLSSHNGQNDFSVLLQSQSITVTNSVLDLLTKLIVGIAAISLVVGGIGIMNIMLVSVTERTREIGIRKAIGATNRQILSQFLIEAVVLSISGGIIGIVLSFAVDYLIRVFSNLQPIITWQIVVLATAVALVIGAVFGALPAIQAARKDPIDSLRYE